MTKKTFILFATCMMLLAACGMEDPTTTPITPPTPPETGNENGNGNGNENEGDEKTPYAALKTYIDRAQYPDFQFGVAMGAWISRLSSRS